jgi:uncharacterized membrane protein YidH (DUF202 family)
MNKILECYYSSFTDDGRKFQFARLVIFGILPSIFSVSLVWKFGAPTKEYLTSIISIYGILLAVLVGMTPLAYSITERSDTNKEYTEANRYQAKHDVHRIETLQDVTASITYASVILVITLIACVILALCQPSVANQKGVLPDKAWEWVSIIFGFVVYLGGMSSVFTFFDISKHIFNAMEDYAEEAKSQIRKHTKQ